MGQLLNLELTHPEFRSTAVSLDPFCRTSCCQPQRGLSTGRIGVQPEGTQQNERPFVYYCPSRTQPAIITVHQLWWKRQESRDGIDWKNWRIFLWRTEWRTEFFNSHVVTAVSYGLDTRCVFQLDGPVDNQEDAVEFLQSAANRFRDGLLDSLAVVDAPSSVSYGHVQVQLFSDWNSCPLPSLPYCEAYRLCHDKFSSLQSANPLTVWLCPVKKKKFPPPRRPFAGPFLPEASTVLFPALLRNSIGVDFGAPWATGGRSDFHRIQRSTGINSKSSEFTAKLQSSNWTKFKYLSTEELTRTMTIRIRIKRDVPPKGQEELSQQPTCCGYTLILLYFYIP